MPILIQWLHRRNYTERVWAAMRFLRAATKAQSRRLRFESLVLLAIRTLILLLAAVALAEPFLELNGWLPTSASSVHRLLVIDTSLSMQHEADGRSAGDRAKEAALRIVREAQPGDSFQVVTASRQPAPLIRQAAYDAVEVAAELDQLTGTEEFGDAAAALQMAQQLLEGAPAVTGTELIVISDFQRSNWWPEQPAARSRLQRTMAELASVCEISLVRVGAESPTNLAVDAVTIDTAPITQDAAIEVAADIRRSGGAGGRAETRVNVELVESDRVLQTASIGLPASGSGTALFSHRWREPGWHGLEVRLAGDGLAADDHRWMVVNVRDELDVLLVNGLESSASLGRATDFVELALAPLLPSERSTGPVGRIAYRPQVVNEAEFLRTELAGFDCVVLCDVPFLSEAEQARLRTFVRGGGGLIISAGPQVQLDAYNQWLADADAPLLDVRLTRRMGDAQAEADPFRFAEPEQNSSPIVEPFVGNPQAGLTTANIYQYVQIEMPRDEPESMRAGGQEDGARSEVPPAADFLQHVPRVALAYTNGDPAIVEQDFGAGRVLLVSTSLDDRWGSWALWPSFLPMVHRMVDHATAGSAPRSRLVGDELELEYPVQTVGLSVTLQQPDGRRQPGRSHVDDGATVVTFGAVTQSGLYRVLLGPPLNRTELLAVNTDPRESQLSLLTGRELQGTLLSGVQAELFNGADALTTTQRTAEDAPSPLTRWLLMIVFALLLVEQTMAWNARIGLIALACLPFVLGAFGFWPVTTVVLVIAGLAGLLITRWRAGRLTDR